MNMLRQFLVGGGVSLINIAIHALIMTMVVQVARAMGRKRQPHSSLVLIDDPDHLSSDGCAYNRSICMGFGVLDIRCGSRGSRSGVFCVRELRDTGLWRRASGGTLAAAWASNRNERHVAVWMVDRSHFRGPTANVGARSPSSTGWTQWSRKGRNRNKERSWQRRRLRRLRKRRTPR